MSSVLLFVHLMMALAMQSMCLLLVSSILELLRMQYKTNKQSLGSPYGDLPSIDMSL